MPSSPPPPAFVTPDVIFLQEANGTWWRLSPEKFQTLTQTAFRRESVGRALDKLGRRQQRAPAGLERLAPEKVSSVFDGVGYVRAPRNAADWRKSLLTLDLRPERFTFLGFVFDVSKAKRLARRRHLEVHRAVPDESWWGRNWRGSIKISQEHLQRRLDLNKPVIRGTLVDELGEFSLLIDGNHRATLALGRKVEVPYVILPVPDTLDTVTNKGAIRALRTRPLRRAQEESKGGG